MKQIFQNRGFLLVGALIVVAIIALLAALASQMYSKNVQSGTSYLQARQAYYVAQSGVQRGAYQFLRQQNPCSVGLTAANCCAALPAQQVSFAQGQYNLTTTFAQPSTMAGLAQTIYPTDSVTQLRLNSTTGYASSGRVVIGTEVFQYNGISGNNLQNVTRAAGGSIAQYHPTSQQVLQSQCQFIAQSGVPSLGGAASGVSTVSAFAMSPNLRFLLYAVGNTGAIAKYNGIYWLSVPYPTAQVFPATNTLPDLNSVSMVASGQEGFIVGSGQSSNNGFGYDDQFGGNWGSCEWNWWFWWPSQWWGCNSSNYSAGWLPVFYSNAALWGSDVWHDVSVNLQGVNPIPNLINQSLVANGVVALGNGTGWLVGNRMKITQSGGCADIEDDDDQRDWWWYPGHCWHYDGSHHRRNVSVYQYLIAKIQCNTTTGACTVTPGYPSSVPGNAPAGSFSIPANDNNNGNLVGLSMINTNNGLMGVAVDDNGNVIVYNNGNWQNITWGSGTLSGTPLGSVQIVSTNEVWIGGLNGIWKITPGSTSGTWQYTAVPISISPSDIVTTLAMYDGIGAGTATDGWAITTSGQLFRYQNVSGTWKWTNQGTQGAIFNHQTYSSSNIMLNSNYSWTVGSGTNGGSYYNGVQWQNNNGLPMTNTTQYNSIANVIVDTSFYFTP
jgi:type II secretory pathway pseudopilin PulG